MKTITEKDLEMLQRYNCYDEYSWEFYEEKSDNGEYVRWDSLIQQTEI